MGERLHDVCSTCIEAFRILTIYLKPMLPRLAADVASFLIGAARAVCRCQQALAPATRSANTST